MKSNKLSYLEERLTALGISKDQLKVSVHDPDFPPQSLDLFSSDEKGNINILYLDPDGQPMKYDEKGKLRQFTRKRYRDPVNGKKYSQPYRSGVFPFITPGIIKKYKKGEKIKTLFIVEGEFKAFSGNLSGLDTIGIGGIHNYKDKDKNTLDDYLLNIVNKCKVKNIVLLFDADCLTVEYEENKDLYTRPNSFYTAVKNFKELTKPLSIDIYFSHILTKYENTAKGLDDLINYKDTNKETLKKELYSFRTGSKRKYIHTISISENSILELRKYFGIDNVDNFYLKYSNIIQEEVFIYNRSRYQHNGKKLEIIRHGDADLFLRVGCDYFKKVATLNSKGNYEIVLKKWKTTEITRDYVKRGITDFFEQIQKHDGFCNIPDNSSNYNRVHIVQIEENQSINYNLYEPLEFELKEGEFQNTKNFLNHITSNKNQPGEYHTGDKYTILLDYLTILFKNPIQKLPVLCLVSKIQGTGKSTFLKWLKLIYKSNAVILGNNEFKMEFNYHYITKLLIMVDESLIALEARKEKERMKKLATDDKQLVQLKGIDLFEIDFYGKLIMCSNYENNFIPLEKEDIRFFILKLPQFEKEDPDFLEKLESEIPYFLYYLNNRKIFHPKESRAWFNHKYIRTEQYEIIIDNTKSRLEQDIEDYVKDYLLTFQSNELKIDAKILTQKVNENAKYKHSKSEIVRFLKNEKEMIPGKVQRYELYESLNPDLSDEENYTLLTTKYMGRVYIFRAENWLNEEELKNLVNNL